MKKIFFDLETTGTQFWQHGIHQISGCVEIDGEVKEFFNYHVRPNPKAKIEDEALAVAGKTREEIAAYEPMEEVYKRFLELLGKYVNKYKKTDKFFLVGFNNAHFDNQFLRAWFVQNGDDYFGSWFWANPLDVYVLATERLLEQRHEMKDFKLKTVCQFLGMPVDETRLHDAEYDIELTRSLYYKVR